MRKIIISIVFVVFLMLFNAVLADTIYRKNGRKTICIISDVYPELIMYRLLSDVHGAERKMKKTEIAVIFYDNGTYDVFPETNIGKTRNYRKPVSDIIITKNGRILKTNIIKVEKKKMQFTLEGNANDDTVYTRYVKSTIAVVYSTGKHQLFSTGRRDLKVLKEQKTNFLKLLAKESDVVSEKSDEVPKESDIASEEIHFEETSITTGKLGNTPELENSNDIETSVMNTSSKENEVDKDVMTLSNKKEPRENKFLNELREGEGRKNENLVKKASENIDFDLFEAKSQEKINDLTAYLGVLASRYTDASDANNAIELAVSLFVNEEAEVQVSSVKRSEIRTFPIRTYLERLKLLKYDHVEMDWVDISYVSDFRKGQDGNYYGTVSMKQTFKGYMENTLVYQDTTEKDIEVIVKGIEKNSNGKVEHTWDVLLSDIGVRNTNGENKK